MPKIAFQKCNVITFTYLFFFLSSAEPKTKILLWNFICVLLVGMYFEQLKVRSHVFLFFNNMKHFYFIVNCFWKTNEILSFGGQNWQISKIRDDHFVERSIWRQFYVWHFWIASYLKTEHSSSLQTFAVFCPKMAKHDVTKTPFSEKLVDRFFWNSDDRHQIDAGEGTKRSRC